MKYFRYMIMIVALFFSMESLKSNEWLNDSSYESDDQLYSGEESGARSYHGATYDLMTGAEQSPFMFTTSSLGHALRATSFLLGHVYAAAEDRVVREQLAENIDTFCEKILNVYVLCHEALGSVGHQMEHGSEKSGYLLEEVEQLHQRLVMLRNGFEQLVGDASSHEISTILVTLHILIKKTGQMLAL